MALVNISQYLTHIKGKKSAFYHWSVYCMSMVWYLRVNGGVEWWCLEFWHKKPASVSCWLIIVKMEPMMGELPIHCT